MLLYFDCSVQDRVISALKDVMAMISADLVRLSSVRLDFELKEFSREVFFASLGIRLSKEACSLLYS